MPLRGYANLSRRSFLTVGTAAIGGVLASPKLTWAREDEPAVGAGSLEGFEPTASVDVVVVGAGLSGLVAARHLARAGADVRVLEARPRVGGRTLSMPLAQGQVIADGGAQWVGPGQNSILSLMKELRIATAPTYTDGKMVGDIEGDIGMLAGLDYEAGAKRLNVMAKQVPLASPWAAKKARAWDAISVGEWIDEHTRTVVGGELLKLEVQSGLGAPASGVSLLYFLFHVRSAGGFESYSETAQTWTIDGGAQLISTKLARDLGDRVVAGAAVSSIHWEGARPRVRTPQALFEAKRVVVAMMPRDADRIGFFPVLPRMRQALQRNWTARAGSKFHCVYPTPFWREMGLNGLALSEQQFIAMAVDSSPHDGALGMLTGFPGGEEGMPSDPVERKRLVIESFVEFYGPKAARPIDYAEKVWADDPFSAGCLTALEPGALMKWGPALREPIGPIHWAGTETSEVSCGYMDGAVNAGERVAREVLTALRGGLG